MSRFIDADALMNALCELRDNAIKWLADCREQRSAMTAIRAEQAVLTFNECISQVKKSSEVDAVPVVRCEDCKWYKTMYCKMDRWTDLVTVYVAKADDYCSYGEWMEK